MRAGNASSICRARYPFDAKESFMARILITSALPYINGIKHLGNLVGSMLPADAYAKFERLRGNNVLCICATDEHGTPAELAAQDAGQAVEDYCTEMHDVQRELGERYGLSFDWFGRTSRIQTHEITQHLAHRLDQAGLIEEVTTHQVFSIDDNRFLPDRYVEGTCPHCGYERARGDQCENCTRVLDPIDLKEPRSAVSGSTNIEVRDSTHLFLRQSQMVNRLRKWIDSRVDWPLLVRSIAQKWLDEGLNDRGITRDLKWGIPVAYEGAARPGFEEKVFYVWFDAPIGYIGATKEWSDAGNGDWEAWWREDKGADDVRYVQFMGKDNIPFHSVSFPITLLGTNDYCESISDSERWKTVDYIKGLNWMNYYEGKFSTTQKRGVFMDHGLEIAPPDYWRWFLLSNVPESDDSNFTWEVFQVAVNKDLADVLGNLVNRVLKFTASRFGNEVPAGGEAGPEENALIAEVEKRLTAYTAEMEALNFRKSTHELRAIWAAGNEYLQRAEPWAKFKTDPDAAAASVRMAINLIGLIAQVSAPFIPFTCTKLADCLNLTETDWVTDIRTAMTALPAGHPFTVPDVMFTKVDDDRIAELKDRFGGED